MEGSVLYDLYAISFNQMRMRFHPGGHRALGTLRQPCSIYDKAAGLQSGPLLAAQPIRLAPS